MTHLLVLISLVISAFVSVGPRGKADADRLTREGFSLFQRGEALMTKGKSEEGRRLIEKACESFAAALELLDSPQGMFNVARCHSARGAAAEAYLWYVRLAIRPDVASVPIDFRTAQTDKLRVALESASTCAVFAAAYEIAEGKKACSVESLEVSASALGAAQLMSWARCHQNAGRLNTARKILKCATLEDLVADEARGALALIEQVTPLLVVHPTPSIAAIPLVAFIDGDRVAVDREFYIDAGKHELCVAVDFAKFGLAVGAQCEAENVYWSTEFVVSGAQKVDNITIPGLPYGKEGAAAIAAVTREHLEARWGVECERMDEIARRYSELKMRHDVGSHVTWFHQLQSFARDEFLRCADQAWRDWLRHAKASCGTRHERNVERSLGGISLEGATKWRRAICAETRGWRRRALRLYEVVLSELQGGARTPLTTHVTERVTELRASRSR